MSFSVQHVEATEVRLSDERLIAHLRDGREISVPLSWFPRLLTATAEQRADWRLIGTGEGIHWPQLDEDLSVEALLHLP